MTFTISIFLIVYYVIAGLVGLFAFFNLYHLLKFSPPHFAGFFFTFVFLVLGVIIFYVSSQLITAINWQEQISLFRGVSFTSPY